MKEAISLCAHVEFSTLFRLASKQLMLQKQMRLFEFIILLENEFLNVFWEVGGKCRK